MKGKLPKDTMEWNDRKKTIEDNRRLTIEMEEIIQKILAKEGRHKRIQDKQNRTEENFYSKLTEKT